MSRYVKEFTSEHRYLALRGMTEAQIEAFYPVWLEIFRSDASYYCNTWRFGVDADTGDTIEDSIAIPCQFDGTQTQCRKYRKDIKERGENVAASWTSLRLSTHYISSSDPDWCDKNELDEELEALLDSLSEVDGTIVALLREKHQKQEIARKLGVSKKTISVHMDTIKSIFRPYYQKRHMFEEA